MKTIDKNDLIYSLKDSHIFKKELDCEISEVADKLSHLFIEYFKFILENIKFKQLCFYRFIIMRGLDTIINVFNHILFYTNNLDVTYFHCQKAFYFYIEFVSQISEDDNLFLQLSTKDATMYVYKKTIYTIHKELSHFNKNTYTPTNLKFNTINTYISLYKTMLLYLINHNDEFNNTKYITTLEELYNKFNKLNDTYLVEKSNILVENIYYYINDINKFYNIIDLFVNKMVTNPEILKNIKSDTFLLDDFVDNVNNTSNHFITWLTK